VLVFGLVGERFEQGFFPVNAHFNAHTGSDTNESPGLRLFVFLKVVRGL
jgi:hypothetical protein